MERYTEDKYIGIRLFDTLNKTFKYSTSENPLKNN